MTADTQTRALEAEYDTAQRTLEAAEQRLENLLDELAAARGALTDAEERMAFAQDELYGSPSDPSDL